jgi:hypothetical protein
VKLVIYIVVAVVLIGAAVLAIYTGLALQLIGFAHQFDRVPRQRRARRTERHQ